MPAPRTTHRRPARHLVLALVALVAAGLTALVAPAASSAQETAPEGTLELNLAQVVAPGGLDSPIAMATRAGQDDLFVVERPGRVRVIDGETSALQPTPLLDITGFVGSNGEGGLLGLAFNPAGTKLYVNYTNLNGDLRLVEYGVTGTTDTTIVPGSRRQVLKIRHRPFGNHNGGSIAFGPDGKLYIATGDGGGANDPEGNGQDRTQLLGKILRINPTAAGSRPYRIPPTNPYAGSTTRRGEIWIYGVRNPWRISFDSASGDLYVADVGQDNWEEVNVLPSDAGGLNAGRGANLGWSRREGPDPFNGGTIPPHYVGPLLSYPHSADPGDLQGCAIVGGYVSHDPAVPALDEHYVFGDFCTGVLSSIRVNAGGQIDLQQSDLGISVPEFTLQSFGQGPDGEVYVLDGDGSVYRIDQPV